MTQIAIPNLSDSVQFTPVGCPAIRHHLCVDEGVDTPDDGATYLEWETNVTDNFDLSTVDDPRTHWGHKVRLRAGKFTGGGAGTFQLTVELRESGVLIEALDAVTISGTYSNYELPVSIAGAAAIGNYANLQLRVNGLFGFDSGSPVARLTAIQFECPDVGAMQASISMTSAAAGTVLGSGAMGASLALTSTAAGTSTGDAAMGATIPLISTAAGAAAGAGALASSIVAGTSAMPTANMKGSGALAATVPLVSGASGTAAGAAAMAATIRTESHMVGFPDNQLPRQLQLTLPNEGFASPLIWTLMLPDFGAIAFLRVENDTDVRIEGRFGDNGPAEFFVESGKFRKWEWLQEEQLRGPIYVRGSGADPATGDVKAEIHYQ